MLNTTINLGVINKIAHALTDLNEQVVYVGGAVVSLYINDAAADDVRPTKDIDISLEIASIGKLEEIREALIKKGFKQTHEDNVICRFRFDDIKMDVMSTKEVGWAPANTWFAPGFMHLQKREVGDKLIHILPLAYFLATKFEAFHDRGEKEPRLSHDLEDITYILDNRTDLVEAILQAPEDVKPFLKQEFETIINSKLLQESMLGNLFYETQSERLEMILQKLKEIVNM